MNKKRISLIIFALCIVLSVVLLTPKSEVQHAVHGEVVDISKYVSDAEKYYRLGHYLKALKSIRKALRLDEKQASYHWLASQAARGAGQREDALKHARDTWKYGMHEREVILTLLRLTTPANRQQIHFQESLLAMSSQLKNTEEEAITTGDLKIQFNDQAGALAVWRRQFKVRPSSGLAQRIGSCEIGVGNLPGALSFFNKCYYEKILDIRGTLIYARLFLLACRYDHCFKILNKVRLKHPESSPVLLEIGYCYFLQGDYSRATQTLKKLNVDRLKKGELKQRRLVLAVCALLTGGKERLEHLLVMAAGDTAQLEGERLLYKALRSLLSGQHLDVETNINNSRRLLPGNNLVLFIEMYYKASLGQHRKVLETVAKISDQIFRSSPLFTKFHVQALIASRRYIEAENILLMEFKKRTYTYSSLQLLQDVYEATGNLKKSRRVAKLTLKLFPDKVYARFRAIDGAIRLGLDSDAEQLLLTFPKGILSSTQEQVVELYLCIVRGEYGDFFDLLEKTLLPAILKDKLTSLVAAKVEAGDFKDALVDAGSKTLTAWAHNSLRHKQMSAAKNAFSHILKAYPEQASGYIGMALLKGSEEKYDEAEILLKKAISLKALNPVAKIIQAQLSSVQNKPSDALRLLEELPAKYQGQKEVLTLRAQSLMQTDKWVVAIQVLLYLDKLQEATSEEYLLLARCYIKVDLKASALKLIAKHKLASKGDPYIQAFLVASALAQKETKKAVKLFKKMKVNNSTAYLLLAATMAVHQGEPARASKILRESLNEPRCYLLWARIQFLLGEGELATSRLSQVKLEHNDLIYLAAVAEKQQDFLSASQFYSEALVDHEDDAKLLNNLAWSLFKAAKFSEALRVVKKANVETSGNGDILHTYSSILLVNKQFKECIILLERENIQEPSKLSSPELVRNLALAYRHLGQHQKALGAYKNSMKFYRDGYGPLSAESLLEVTKELEDRRL